MTTKAMKLAMALIGLLLWGAAHAGTKHYYYTDPQGTVLAKADAQGNIVASYDYAPYGTQVLGAPPSGPTGYTGHVNDAESGFVYMQQRYYDPDRGGFLSVDPVGPTAGNIFSFNRYDYANNNPLRYTDPDGRCVDGLTCGKIFQAHVKWRLSHPNAPADGLEKAAFVGVGVMAAPTVGAGSIILLRSPLTYLAFSFGTKDLDVVEAMKAAQARQRAAELVEAAKETTKKIEQRIEELLEQAEKKNVQPPPPPKLPEPPPPPKSSSDAPVVPPGGHADDDTVIPRDQF